MEKKLFFFLRSGGEFEWEGIVLFKTKTYTGVPQINKRIESTATRELDSIWKMFQFKVTDRNIGHGPSQHYKRRITVKTAPYIIYKKYVDMDLIYDQGTK